ncbi:hypothetical protein [Burkholderia sp. AU45388]|uniref:hypothetical protein n=1 Tax=Burkholderia sp. AU45388 TaxID=3059206 RepID=UPI0034622A1C
MLAPISTKSIGRPASAVMSAHASAGRPSCVMIHCASSAGGTVCFASAAMTRFRLSTACASAAPPRRLLVSSTNAARAATERAAVRVRAAVSVKFGIRNISIVMRDGMDKTKGHRARGTPANAGTTNGVAQRAASAGARCTCGHSWIDGAESASV